MSAMTPDLEVTWEKLPADYVLDDAPVDHLAQPALAAALIHSLEVAGRLPPTALAMTNYGICATVNRRIVVKAPDWCFVPAIRASFWEIFRSYTPRLQGDIPLIVMEFLSDTLTDEYSRSTDYPYGKWFFYEQILQVPHYFIYDIAESWLEAYRLDDRGNYQQQEPDANNRYWIEEMGLFLGVRQGTRENLSIGWLRWWDQEGRLLLWGSELTEQIRQERESIQRETEEYRRQTRWQVDE
jgi:hypothetical protein